MQQPTVTMAAVLTTLLAVGIGIVHGQQKKTPGEGFAAIPGLKGGQDVFGPYDPVQNWPRPLSESLPNHEGWTWSQATDVFAESPDRVFVTQKGELPVLPVCGRGTTWLPQIGPEHQVPRRRRRAGARNGQRHAERRQGRGMTDATAGPASTGGGSTSSSCSIATAR